MAMVINEIERAKLPLHDESSDAERTPLLHRIRPSVPLSPLEIPPRSKSPIQESPEPSPKPAKKRSRILSLDILRGISVIGMIIVNNNPLDGEQWWIMQETDWVGLHPADFIMSTFLFVMGYAMGIVFSRRVPNPEKYETHKIFYCMKRKMKNRVFFRYQKWVRILRRTILLYVLGLGINFVETLPNEIYLIRWSCVLARIAVCYIVNSIIISAFSWVWTQILVVFNLNLLYLFIMWCFPVPGCGAGNITKSCSAEAYFDQILFGGRNHIWGQGEYDPEGVVSSLTAITTVFFGYLYFKISRFNKRKHNGDKYYLMFYWLMFSLVLVSAALLIHYLLWSFNKEIWNTPFILISAGFAGITLVVLMYFVDILKIKFWMHLFLWVGVNPLFMYIVPQYVGALFDIIVVAGQKGLDIFLTNVCLVSWIKNKGLANAIYGILFEAAFIPAAAILYWRKIYIKL